MTIKFWRVILDFTPSVLPTLLAHRLSPSDDDSSTALYDSGVSSHTADANFDDDDDDDEPPPVLDLYGCSLPEPVQAIEVCPKFSVLLFIDRI